ncbi:MAG: hypothetical protein J6S67_23520 [Methanobrevibacter sp.]|nr:hypothetical protein [Methanobrevibacter sp.]
MKYYIRTTLERELDESYNQIDYTLIVDKESKPIDNFVQSLYQISEDDAVLLEDDLILCKNFDERIHNAIQEYPNRIINFFQAPWFYQLTKEDGRISYNQCTFYPKGIAQVIAKEMEQVPRIEKYPKSRQYSLIEYQAMQNLGLTLIQYRPALVQHLDMKSLLFPHSGAVIKGMRRCPFFIDYLDELGISYEEAKDYQKELRNCMARHFSEIEKRLENDNV